MPLPPPLPDPMHIEARLAVVEEMLERAITEVRRVTEELSRDVRAAVREQEKQ